MSASDGLRLGGAPGPDRSHDEPLESGPFSGGVLPENPYAQDDGRPDEAVVQALGAYEQGVATGTEVLEALARSRLLVPVVAMLDSEVEAEDEAAPDGADGADGVGPASVLRREKESSMATVTVQHPDGSSALLAFTGTEPLRRWRADARPIAVPARRAAAAALAEGAAMLLLDVAGPRPFGVEGVELRSLAFAPQVGLPLAEDPQVAEAVTAVLADEAAVLAARLAAGVRTAAPPSVPPSVPPPVAPPAAALAPGVREAAAPSGDARDPGALRITLVVDPAIGPEGFRALVPRVSHALAADVVLRSRVPGGLQVAVVAPGHEDGTGVLAFRRAGSDR